MRQVVARDSTPGISSLKAAEFIALIILKRQLNLQKRPQKVKQKSIL